MVARVARCGGSRSGAPIGTGNRVRGRGRGDPRAGTATRPERPLRGLGPGDRLAKRGALEGKPLVVVDRQLHGREVFLDRTQCLLRESERLAPELLLAIAEV